MTATITQFEVKRDAMGESRWTEAAATPLAPGQIRAAVERFGFTANNITYGVAGDMIGYWKFYPAADGYGVIPVWGIATVTESANDTLPVGTRFWGFIPMASHVTLSPVSVSDQGFIDATPHRVDLPAVYNQYQISPADPDADPATADADLVFRPLFTTGFLIDDWLAENSFFGAEQVVLASASSKTALGAAFCIHRNRDVALTGLTSKANEEFVERTGYYSPVVRYGAIGTLDPGLKTAFVDMSGNGQVIGEVHVLYGANLKVSSIVGMTHWDKMGPPKDLPGPKPAMFFAPDIIKKRMADWGAEGFNVRMREAARAFAEDSKRFLDIHKARGPDAIEQLYHTMREGHVPPQEGHILAF